MGAGVVRGVGSSVAAAGVDAGVGTTVVAAGVEEGVDVVRGAGVVMRVAAADV